MTTLERIHQIVDALTLEQQEQLLRIAEEMISSDQIDLDRLLALPLSERARLMEHLMSQARFDDYEIFEANDPIRDYDDDTHH